MGGGQAGQIAIDSGFSENNRAASMCGLCPLPPFCLIILLVLIIISQSRLLVVNVAYCAEVSPILGIQTDNVPAYNIARTTNNETPRYAISNNLVSSSGSQRKTVNNYLKENIELGILTRSYYSNDQRIEWSGNEETFGVEGIISPSLSFNSGNYRVQLFSEFYLNQPTDKNLYIYNGEIQSYAANYAHDYFETSQLYISLKTDQLELRFGKFETPFGRYYFPLMSNFRTDAPFIRTESILWRQTGMMLHWTPSIFEVDAAFTNGSTGLDTNSSKTFIGRIGLKFENLVFGCSGLMQDGIGSEDQKEFKRHAGIDAMVRCGNWTLSAEGIYDEYGMYHDFEPNNIFWEKSIYYRQLNKREHTPIVGFGYYVDLNYRYGDWIFGVNYGEYYPEELHNPNYPQHDIITRRVVAKIGWNITKNLQWYGSFLKETDGHIIQEGDNKKGWHLITGLKMEY